MFNLMQKCPNCNSTTLLEILEPEGSVHYARVSCGECNRFIKWSSKPKISAKPFDVSIVRLLQHSDLQLWERQFLKTVVLRTPTNAEEIVIRAIEAKVNPVSNERGVS